MVVVVVAVVVIKISSLMVVVVMEVVVVVLVELATPCLSKRSASRYLGACPLPWLPRR